MLGGSTTRVPLPQKNLNILQSKLQNSPTKKIKTSLYLYSAKRIFWRLAMSGTTDLTGSTNLDDIQSGEGIEVMVNSFYSNARQDELLGPIFDRAITDWQDHLPTMYQFWERLLFGFSDYNGNPFEKHLPLSLQAVHFTRWVNIFIQTIDENFSGPKAEEAKRLARNIAGSFQLRMGIKPEDLEFEAVRYSRR